VLPSPPAEPPPPPQPPPDTVVDGAKTKQQTKRGSKRARVSPSTSQQQQQQQNSSSTLSTRRQAAPTPPSPPRFRRAERTTQRVFCPECYLVYSCRTSLVKHLCTMHQVPKPSAQSRAKNSLAAPEEDGDLVRCPYCMYKTTDLQSFREHMLEEHKHVPLPHADDVRKALQVRSSAAANKRNRSLSSIEGRPIRAEAEKVQCPKCKGYFTDTKVLESHKCTSNIAPELVVEPPQLQWVEPLALERVQCPYCDQKLKEKVYKEHHTKYHPHHPEPLPPLRSNKPSFTIPSDELRHCSKVSRACLRFGGKSKKRKARKQVGIHISPTKQSVQMRKRRLFRISHTFPTQAP